jgi:hypothetical protein
LGFVAKAFAQQEWALAPFVATARCRWQQPQQDFAAGAERGALHGNVSNGAALINSTAGAIRMLSQRSVVRRCMLCSAFARWFHAPLIVEGS